MLIIWCVLHKNLKMGSSSTYRGITSCAHAYNRIYTRTYLHTFTHAHTHAITFIECLRIHIQKHTHTNTQMHTCAYTLTHTCVPALLLCRWMTLLIHIHIHTHAYTHIFNRSFHAKSPANCSWLKASSRASSAKRYFLKSSCVRGPLRIAALQSEQRAAGRIKTL